MAVKRRDAKIRRRTAEKIHPKTPFLCKAAVPIRFRNVHYYRVAGKYIFAGDLFITRGRLHFFPEVDLEQQREKLSHVFPHELGLFLVAMTYLAQRVGSYKSRVNFWKDGMSDEEFQRKAAVYVDDLKLRYLNHEFGKTLPLPTYCCTAEISDMKLTAAGKLSFHAQSDTHDFYIGLRRRKQLRNALWEAGLGRV